MKGMIFTEFLEMVEDQFGLVTVDNILAQAQPKSGGAYTSVGNYHHSEMVQLVRALSNATEVPSRELLQTFGHWVFLRLFAANYGSFFVNSKNAYDFLSSVESYIHVEVRKLYPDAELPTFAVQRPDADCLIMVYHSARPFAAFAHGLILGCIDYYDEDIDVSMEDTSSGRGTSARFTLTRLDTSA